MKRRWTACLCAFAFALPALLFSACGSGGDTDFDYVREDLSETGSAELEALADYQVFYKPDGGRVGDVMPYYEDGVYYLYYLRDGGGSSAHPAYMVSTTDFVNYIDYGEVLPEGDSNAVDAMIGTGCILKHNDVYYFFYTGHPEEAPEQILVATSPNVTDFEKQESFAIAPSDYGFETNDFRDPEVSFNEETGRFDCIVSTRQNGKAVLALFTFSEDLSEVRYEGILYEDGHGFNVLECPTRFQLGDRWYITYSAQDLSLDGKTNDTNNDQIALTGDKGNVYYLVAEQKDGPYREMEDPALDSVVFYAGKVAKGSETMLVGWSAERNEKYGYAYAWGGNLEAHVIVQNPDGSLSLTYPAGYAEHFDMRLPLLLTEEDEGGETVSADSYEFIASSGTLVDLANEVQEYRLSMDITFDEGTSLFGLAFALGVDLNDTVRVTFDPVMGKIKAQYDRAGEMAARYVSLEANKTFHIDLFVEGSNYVLYCNGTAFTFKVRGSGGRNIAMFADGGSVTMANIAMFAPSGEHYSGKLSLAAGESKTVSVSAASAAYLRGTAELYAAQPVTVEILSGDEVLDSTSGTGYLSLDGYRAAAKGDTLSVRVTAQSDAAIYGFIGASQSYYVPVAAKLLSRVSENRGASVTVGAGQAGCVSVYAIAAQSGSSDSGRLVLTKNGTPVADTVVSGGYARLNVAIEADADDVLAAGIDFDGAAVSYSCSIAVYAGAAVESNLAVTGADRPYTHDLGVALSGDRSDNVNVQESFGAQGTNGFVYTYGAAIDEMRALTEYDTNFEESYNYRYTQSDAASAIEVKADWMKTGSYYMTGVTYIAAQSGELNIELRVKPNSATGGFILVQLYHNRNRLREAIVAAGWDWQTYTCTVNVEAGDEIIFGMKNAPYSSAGDAADVNYSFAVSTPHEVQTIADFVADFSTENNPNNGWSYGSALYDWNGNNAIKDSAGSESFTFTKSKTKNGGGDGWTAYGVEIKAGWLSSNEKAAISYTFAASGSATFEMNVNGVQENTRLSVRYILVGADQTAKVWVFKDGKAAKDWSIAERLPVSAGDTLYIIFFNEATSVEDGYYPQANFTIQLKQ